MSSLTGTSPPGIARRAASAFAAMLAQNLLSRAIAYASQIVLAAVLMPADFGLIGLATMTNSLISLFVSFGVDDVLLQRHSGIRFWANTAFWLSLAASTLAAVLLLAASPVVAWLYSAPQLVPLLALIAASVLLGATATVPGVLLRQQMRFHTLVAYATGELLVQTGATVALALCGFGAFSFVLPLPVVAAVRGPAYWLLVRQRPGFSFQRRRWRMLFGRSAINSVSNVLIGLIAQGDYFVLGLFATKAEVGAYFLAFRLSAQPVWMLAGNLNSIMLPVLTRLRHDLAQQRTIVLSSAALLANVVIPVTIICAAVTPPALALLFDARWSGTAPLIQLLSIGLSFDAVSWIAGSALVARGEFLLTLKFLVIQAPVFFALVVAGASTGGALGVAAAVCLYYVATQPFYVYAVFKRFGVGPAAVVRLYLLPAGNAAAAVLAGKLVSQSPFVPGGPLADLLVTGTVAVLCYVGLVRVLAPDIWQEGSRRLRQLRQA